MIVDAKDDAARNLYQRYGFLDFAREPDRLYLPMRTIERLIALDDRGG